ARGRSLASRFLNSSISTLSNPSLICIDRPYGLPRISRLDNSCHTTLDQRRAELGFLIFLIPNGIVNKRRGLLNSPSVVEHFVYIITLVVLALSMEVTIRMTLQ